MELQPATAGHVPGPGRLANAPRTLTFLLAGFLAGFASWMIAESRPLEVVDLRDWLIATFGVDAGAEAASKEETGSKSGGGKAKDASTPVGDTKGGEEKAKAPAKADEPTKSSSDTAAKSNLTPTDADSKSKSDAKAEQSSPAKSQEKTTKDGSGAPKKGAAKKGGGGGAAAKKKAAGSGQQGTAPTGDAQRGGQVQAAALENFQRDRFQSGILVGLTASLIGILVGFVDGLWRRSLPTMLIGIVAAAVFGALIGFIGGHQAEDYQIVHLGENQDLAGMQRTVIAYAIAWTVAGLAIGIGAGLGQRSLRGLVMGAIGGALGGVVATLVAYPIVMLLGAQLYPHDQTDLLIPDGVHTRLISLVVVGGMISVVIGGLLHHRPRNAETVAGNVG